LSSVTFSDSSRSTWNTRDNLPIARILFLMALRRTSIDSGSLERAGEAGPGEVVVGVSSLSSSSEHVLRMARSMSVIFSPTKGRDQVKTSIKLGSQ
jgi:hypothetical protein